MKLNEVETQVKLKFKTAIQSLESKVSNLEEQLDTETRFQIRTQFKLIIHVTFQITKPFID